jgi:hypothetical protein
MAIRFNPETGKWEDDSPQPASSVATMTPQQAFADPFEQSIRDVESQNKLANKQFLESTKTGGTKPMFADSPGQFMDELGNILGNAVTGIGTDFLDLGAGLADVAVSSVKQATGQDANWDEVFDDSDNPWTQWRRHEFESQTQAGKMVSDVVRLGTLIATLPKSALKGAAMAPRLIGKVGLLGDVARGAAKVAGGLDKADEALKAGRTAYKAGTEALKATGFAKGTAAGRAANIAAQDDWLRLTFKEVADVPEVANWWTSVQQSTKALTQLGREKAKLRTVGEALAWDALATFSVYGEGDDEFDQTLGDTLREMGLPNILPQTDMTDTALERKVKQMAEGLAMAPLINGLLDMTRVYRFSRNFAKATGAERDAIVKAFNAEADELGRGLTKLTPESAGAYRNAGVGVSDFATPRGTGSMPPGWDPANDPWQKGGALSLLNSQVVTQRIGNQYQTDLLGAQAMAGMPRGTRPRLPGQAGLGAGGELMPPVEGVDVRDISNVQGLPGGPEAKPGSMPAGTLGAGGELVPVTPGMEQVQVMDMGPRPPEPTVTPQTIRNAFQADAYNAFMRSQELTYVEGPDGVMRSMAELNAGVKQLMPRTRVDAMEYITKFPPQANELGVIPAADSVWMNFIIDRGLSEGWASIDPDTMRVRFNRKSALELDRGDLAAKQAKAMDELNELNRYQEWLWNKELVNGSPQMRPEVQDNLAAKEARDAYDRWEAGQAAAREADPAAADAERRAVTAGIEADQLDNAEAVRVSNQEAAAVAGALDDDTVVREYLGTTLDSVQPPEVLKAEVGRGWDVFSVDGEKIATTRTQREANKLADAELRRNREALIGRARQLEADGMDQALNTTVGQPILDSDIAGTVKLTDSQIDAIQKFSPAIQNQMRADWEKRTGGQAWININELKGGAKKTFELTQGEMLDLADGIKALLQTGEVTGPRARVLRNVADKLSTSMKLLEPQARAQRFADNITAEAQRFIDHGDFC